MVPPTVCGVGSSESRVVCGKQKWGSRSPAAVRCFDSASKQAHSKRFATSEAPCGSAAAHGLLRLAAAVGDERGWKPALQRDAISTGGSRGAWSWSCRRAVAGGETVARRGGPSAGAPAAEERSECATAQEWAGPWGGRYELGGSMRVQSSGPASFGIGPWRKLCWVWIPFGATGAGRCCPRAAAPPRGPKTEMLRQGPLDRLTARSVTGLVRVRGCLKTAVAGRKRWMPWESHGPVWRPRESPGNWGCRWSLGSVGDRSVLGSMGRRDLISRARAGSLFGGWRGSEGLQRFGSRLLLAPSRHFVAVQTAGGDASA